MTPVDPDEAAAKCRARRREGRSQSSAARTSRFGADAICVHSDTPNAVELASRRARRAGRGRPQRLVRAHSREDAHMATKTILSPLPGPSTAGRRRTSRPTRRRATRRGRRLVGLIEVMKTFTEVKAEAARQDRRVPRRQRGAGDGRPAALRARGLSRMAIREAPHRQSRRDRGAHHPRGAASSACAPCRSYSAADARHAGGAAWPTRRSRSARRTPRSPTSTSTRSSPRPTRQRRRRRPSRATASSPRTPTSPMRWRRPGWSSSGPTRRDDPRHGRQGGGARGGGKRPACRRAGQRRAGRRSSTHALAMRRGAIGYPVMIKAAAGGGGRGIRVADDGRGARRS